MPYFTVVDATSENDAIITCNSLGDLTTQVTPFREFANSLWILPAGLGESWYFCNLL
jgi:hypothetical protein